MYHTVERVFFGRVQFSELGFRDSLIFGICRCRILTNSNKSKFSRNANAKVLSNSTQFPQLVCLQNSTIITSRKTYHAVTTGQGTSTWLLFRETNGLKVFRKNFGR